MTLIPTLRPTILRLFIESSVFFTLAEVLAALSTTPDVDDLPIVAAAKKAGVDALVTFDRKHLIRQSVADYIGAIVTTPDQIVKRIRTEKQ